ncbi:MAG: serine--tRNA ligase [Bacteroidetes bacterium HGW-Bacteroidetes-21]|nr:MAG: serine--tRNA ligase [Bacteroidetes bacterium HGW-Bacteroidetes-21]
MLTLKLIQENPELVVEKLTKKNFDAREIMKEITETDKRRRETQHRLDMLQAEMNTLAKEIGILFKSGQKEKAEENKVRTITLKDDIQQLGNELNELEKSLNDKLVILPNIPHESVPAGKSAHDNITIRTGGPAARKAGETLPHWEFTQKTGIIDFETGVKLTGAGFPVYKGKGARLQSGLIRFFLDEAVNAGFTEIMPPLMVNAESAFATGQLPDKDGQMYHATEDNLYLIPTAEVPLTNIYRDMVLAEEELPVKITGYTPCFRREAGSYGKDVRGLNRLHQFDKVEIVCITHPDKSYAMLEEMVNHVAGLLDKLELTWRVVKLCGGDMSFTSALTYDFEVYSSAQDKWLEVSSVSNFETFQSNRLKLRFRDPETKKPRMAHTLNGSALALPRIVAALIENHQHNGEFILPEALHAYTGFKSI